MTYKDKDKQRLSCRLAQQRFQAKKKLLAEQADYEKKLNAPQSTTIDAKDKGGTISRPKKRKVQLNVTFTDRQAQADNALLDPQVRRLLYGGAKGGGKSHFLCVWAFCYAWQIASDFHLLPCKNPPHIGWAGRKQAVDFTATTLQTWRQTIPEEYYTIQSGTEKDAKHILIADRVAIDFGGLDRQENINKFNSAQYGFIAIDQAEETIRDEVAVLMGSLRLKINDKELPYKELYTANPANCWLKEEFVTGKQAKNVFIPALPSDNPYLPKDYEETLRGAFGYRKELLDAYLYGSWELSDDAAQIIKAIWIIQADKFRRAQFRTQQRRYISCDVARFGDDETVIYYFEDTDIIEEEIYGQKDTMYTANRLHVASHRHNNCPIIVDEGGIGGGVIDRLIEMGDRVIPANNSRTATNEKLYYNKRAEVYDTVGRMFSEGSIELHHKDPVLSSQLTAPKYDFRNGRIILEPKESIKQRLDRSPDRADAYVNGVYFGLSVPETDANQVTISRDRVLIPSFPR